MDDSQYLKSNIDLDVDVNTDIESVNVEFPEAKAMLVKRAFASGGGGSLMTIVTWSSEFTSPPKDGQVVYLVVTIKFKQLKDLI